MIEIDDIFICENCNYKCKKISEWSRHVKTKKHNVTDETNIDYKLFECECGNKYKHRQSLQNHKKRCSLNKQNENSINNDLIIELIQANKDLKQLLVDQNKKIMEIVKDTKSVTNNINNKFNLNFFLNEQCKDALNIKDFILSLQLQLSDLENVGQLGYVEGISKIIVKGLKELDIYKRPVHCSDIKRETLYVKDENQWIKEENDKKKMKNVIQQITHKNIKNISSWVDKNPSCKDSTSNKNDEYMKLLSNCMSGDCEEEQSTNVNKIITKVAKEIIIEK